MLRRTLIAALLASLALGGPAGAQIPRSNFAPEQRDGDRDQVVPLRDILPRLMREYGGEMLNARERGGTYVISWIDRDKRRLTIVVDARTGRVISAQ